MGVSEEETKAILDFVKKEPRTIQEVAQQIKRSWVTADSYVQQIKERTGLIDIKTFRAGTQGALKLAYYIHAAMPTDDVRGRLLQQIKQGKKKIDFDFLEVFQYLPEEKKKSFIEEYDEAEVSKIQDLGGLFRTAQKVVYCFSGNLSFINLKEKKTTMLDILEELLKKKVQFKILMRVTIASLQNLDKIKVLQEKYPGLLEIRHSHQPLRGFIIDEKKARFKQEEETGMYKKGELQKNTRIFYEVTDEEWVAWLQKVFWSLYRDGIDAQTRMKEMNNLK